MKPPDCASTSRVRLKAHPVPQPKPRDPSRVPQAADPSSTCRQERACGSKETASAAKRRPYAALALRVFALPTVSGRRGGAEKARRVARMDSGQFGVSAWMRCRQTPEPARAVVRFHRTTAPPRAHLWATFLCEQKGGSAGGSPAKRLTRLVKAQKKPKSKWVPAYAGMTRSRGGTSAGPSPQPSPGGEREQRPNQRAAISASMADASRGTPEVITSGEDAVTTTSSSMRTPMPRYSLGTPSSFGAM